MLPQNKVMGRTKNESIEFVGLDTLNARHAQQLVDFEVCASRKDWLTFTTHTMIGGCFLMDAIVEPMVTVMLSISKKRMS